MVIILESYFFNLSIKPDLKQIPALNIIPAKFIDAIRRMLEAFDIEISFIELEFCILPIHFFKPTFQFYDFS